MRMEVTTFTLSRQAGETCASARGEKQGGFTTDRLDPDCESDVNSAESASRIPSTMRAVVLPEAGRFCLRRPARWRGTRAASPTTLVLGFTASSAAACGPVSVWRSSDRADSARWLSRLRGQWAPAGWCWSARELSDWRDFVKWALTRWSR